MLATIIAYSNYSEGRWCRAVIVANQTRPVAVNARSMNIRNPMVTLILSLAVVTAGCGAATQSPSTSDTASGEAVTTTAPR